MGRDSVKNNAIAIVATGGFSSSALTVNLLTGQSAKLAGLVPPFNMLVYNATDYSDSADDPDLEYVRVTNMASDVLTISRAQEGTTAKNHNLSGKTYKMVRTWTTKDVDDIWTRLGGIPLKVRASALADEAFAASFVDRDGNPVVFGSAGDYSITLFLYSMTPEFHQVTFDSLILGVGGFTLIPAEDCIVSAIICP